MAIFSFKSAQESAINKNAEVVRGRITPPLHPLQTGVGHLTIPTSLPDGFDLTGSESEQIGLVVNLISHRTYPTQAKNEGKSKGIAPPHYGAMLHGRNLGDFIS